MSGGGGARRSLWRQSDFVRFYAGHLVSDAGSAVTTVALPLTAIVTLGAGPAEMAWLVALGQLPVPIFGLFAGVQADRRARRPLMLACQVGRALLLAAIPAAALAGALRIEQLWLIAFLVGTLTVVFDIASTSYLPTLVGRAELLGANARLQMATQIAGVTGRAGGGVLVQAISAPLAILVDALSFLVSAVFLAVVRVAEPQRAPAGERPGVWREIGAGLRLTFAQPVIASMTIVSTIGSMGGAVQQTVLFLFMANALELQPAWIGVITGAGAIAAWLGARLSPSAAERIGPGPVMIASGFVYTAGAALAPLAGLVALPALALLMLSQMLMGASLVLFSVNQITLRQAITPDALLGRVNATRRVFVFGAIPIGAWLGGALGETLGLRAALGAGAGLSLLSALYALASPLRRVRTAPAPAS